MLSGVHKGKETIKTLEVKSLGVSSKDEKVFSVFQGGVPSGSKFLLETARNLEFKVLPQTYSIRP